MTDGMLTKLADQQHQSIVAASAPLIANMSDAELHLFTSGTVAMLEAIKQEWDRRILAGSPAAGRA